MHLVMVHHVMTPSAQQYTVRHTAPGIVRLGLPGEEGLVHLLEDCLVVRVMGQVVQLLGVSLEVKEFPLVPVIVLVKRLEPVGRLTCLRPENNNDWTVHVSLEQIAALDGARTLEKRTAKL